VLNERRKFGAKMFSHYIVIVIFALWYFNLNHPVQTYRRIYTTVGLILA